MAELLWGKVTFRDQFAGILREEPGDMTSFEYDPSYLNSPSPAISYTLPKNAEKYVSRAGLLPFFDNLVAEGWLEKAQSKLLGKRNVSRFELLLAFGFDCIGAVSIIDPDPARLSSQLLDMADEKEMAVLTTRASLSGIQPKLAIVNRNGRYFPAAPDEVSTYIAKFTSPNHTDLILTEYLTMQAFMALLPDDQCAHVQIGEVQGISAPALIISRFDRHHGNRLHFEEFNQLLNRKSSAKYDGAYAEIAQFIRENPTCLPSDNYRLFTRILAGFLVGNTDMHFKNFAMFHTDEGLRITPSYDQVSAVLYDYKTLALAIASAPNFPISSLKTKHISRFASEFGITEKQYQFSIKELGKNREAAIETIQAAEFGSKKLKTQLVEQVKKRWNGTFASIGKI